MTTFGRRGMALVAIGYLIAGFAAYWRILHADFLADDWIFLSFVASAHSPLVCFVPLVGHFFRPLVMLTYYVNYHLFGMWTLPYHVTLVLIHIINACLVARLALRLSESRATAIGAGLIFLLFAGHSEAVSWVAGAADPWLACVLLTGLLLLASGLEAERPAWPLAAACALFIGAPLAKESGVIAAAIAGAWGGSMLIAPTGWGDRRRILTRTLVVVLVVAAVAGAYLLVRSHVFGSPFGAYADLHDERAGLRPELRAFVLRSFWPPGTALVWLWSTRHDRMVFVAGAIVLAIVYAVRPAARAGLAFLLGAFLLTLAPILPLNISLNTPASERFVYVPTVFSSILIAWTIALVCGARRWIAAGLTAIVALVQLPQLAASNAEWIAASTLFSGFMNSAVTLLRQEAPKAPARVFLLTLPDDLRGVVVVRSAFYLAVRLMAPDIEEPEQRAIFMASHSLQTAGDLTSVTHDGNRYTVALSAGAFIERSAHDTPDYKYETFSPAGYTVRFRTPRHAVAAYTTGGQLRKAGEILATPFGAFDLPTDDRPCEGAAVRISGWALDEQPGVEVRLETRALGLGRTIPSLPVEWRVGTRPDVARIFAAFQGTNRAEWDAYLPCAAVEAAQGVRLTAIARNASGVEATLGTRTVEPKLATNAGR